MVFFERPESDVPQQKSEVHSSSRLNLLAINDDLPLKPTIKETVAYRDASDRGNPHLSHTVHRVFLGSPCDYARFPTLLQELRNSPSEKRSKLLDSVETICGSYDGSYFRSLRSAYSAALGAKVEVPFSASDKGKIQGILNKLVKMPKREDEYNTEDRYIRELNRFARKHGRAIIPLIEDALTKYLGESRLAEVNWYRGKDKQSHQRALEALGALGDERYLTPKIQKELVAGIDYFTSLKDQKGVVERYPPTLRTNLMGLMRDALTRPGTPASNVMGCLAWMRLFAKFAGPADARAIAAHIGSKECHGEARDTLLAVLKYSTNWAVDNICLRAINKEYNKGKSLYGVSEHLGRIVDGLLRKENRDLASQLLRHFQYDNNLPRLLDAAYKKDPLCMQGIVRLAAEEFPKSDYYLPKTCRAVQIVDRMLVVQPSAALEGAFENVLKCPVNPLYQKFLMNIASRWRSQHGGELKNPDASQDPLIILLKTRLDRGGQDAALSLKILNKIVAERHFFSPNEVNAARELLRKHKR